MKKLIFVTLCVLCPLVTACNTPEEKAPPGDTPAAAAEKESAPTPLKRDKNERSEGFTQNALAALPDAADPSLKRHRTRLESLVKLSPPESFSGTSAKLLLDIQARVEKLRGQLTRQEHKGALRTIQEGLKIATAISAINGQGLEGNKSNPLNSEDKTGQLFKENLDLTDKVWRTLAAVLGVYLVEGRLNERQKAITAFVEALGDVAKETQGARPDNRNTWPAQARDQLESTRKIFDGALKLESDPKIKMLILNAVQTLPEQPVQQ